MTNIQSQLGNFNLVIFFCPLCDQRYEKSLYDFVNFIFRLDKNVPQQPVFFKTKRFASPWEAGGENDARNGTEVDKVI